MDWKAVAVQTWKPRMPGFGFARENEWEMPLKSRLWGVSCAPVSFLPVTWSEKTFPSVKERGIFLE